MERKSLLEKSIQIILENQDPSGSFPASPSFLRFRFCWPRDGIFTATGALAYGHPESTRKFLLWMNKTFLKHKDIVLWSHAMYIIASKAAEMDGV